jgi:NAD kinase
MPTYEKIVLVIRETRLEGLIKRFNTRAQAEFYIEHSGGDFAMYVREHNRYHSALSLLRHYLSQLTKVQVVDRSFLPNFIFAATDLVVTIGIDGLVVNTAKYLEGQPIVAVNPDPAHIDGILLPFDVDTAPPAVRRALAGEAPVREVTMAEARLNDGQTLLAFNDLFIGVKSHVSARYRIQTGTCEEHHSSSGIIVSTGAGSTGWLSSLFNMAQGMVASFSDVSSEVPPARRLPWDTDRLIYVVREPFESKTSGASIVAGVITRETPLILESEMAESGVIFSDGVEADYLAFNAGVIATIGLAAQRTRLVVA